MSFRVCGTCGNIPCACRKSQCTQCGITVNIDAVGMPLMEWNREHQRITSCNGMVLDPRELEKMEKDFENKLQLIHKMRKEQK